MDDRPIKMHLDEEMREHVEFALRRHLVEFEEWKRMKALVNQPTEGWEKEIALTKKCLKEAQEAGR